MKISVERCSRCTISDTVDLHVTVDEDFADRLSLRGYVLRVPIRSLNGKDLPF